MSGLARGALLPLAFANFVVGVGVFVGVTPGRVGVLVGVGLNENQVRAMGRGRKFVGHAGAAIFLLRGGNQQHVAFGQNRAEAGEIAGRR